MLALSVPLGLFFCMPFLAEALPFYSIPLNSSAAISEWGECRTIANNSDAAIFIPTNTAAEWSEFRIHSPNGINLTGCDWQPFFNYRKKITISTNNSRTNYQIKITTDTQSLITAGKMLNNCNDLRFGDSHGNSIDYWIESGCNTPSTVVWIEVADLTAPTTEIFMFYGNPGATSNSNAENTFVLYDNFDDGNYNGWTSGVNNYQAYTYETYTVKISSTDYQSPAYSLNLYGKASCGIPYDGIRPYITRSINPVNGIYILDLSQKGAGGQWDYCSGGTAAQNIAYFDGTAIFNSALCSYTKCNSCSVGWTTRTSSAFNCPGTAKLIKLQTVATDCETANGWWDNVRVRAYMTPEPTSLIGPEEIKP